MRVHAHIPIGEIAASLPQTTKLFDVIGIDYICHGDLSLRDACAAADVDPAIVRKAIEAMPRSEADRPSWSDASMQDLLDELRDRRHPLLRRMLGHTATLLAEASPTPEMMRLRGAFTALSDDLQPHMTHEEHMLFPVVQHLEDCWTHNDRVSMNFVGGIRKPVELLGVEHVRIMERLREVQSAAAALTDDGGAMTRVLDAIGALERELREHIHLENNVLYPRAVAIDAAVAGGGQAWPRAVPR